MVSLALAPGVSPAQANQSIHGHTSLSALLAEMQRAANEGASLEHFGFREDASFAGDRKSCSVVPASRVVEHVRELAEAILPKQGSVYLESGLAELGARVGEGRYLECRESRSEGMSLTYSTHFIGLDVPYQVTFELGFED